MRRKTITTLACTLALAAAGAAAAEAPAPLLGFYPQAGILGQDLFVTNHVDLDPGTGTLDFACAHDTYDGHGGQDTGIRSFREVKIGVPVFAALDGRVLSVQLGIGGDFNWGPTVSRFDNHIILQHGQDVITVYGHLLRRSIKVEEGQFVVAGTQIGLTASSGNSSGPHLHFTIRDNERIHEPFSGACRPGASGWARQPQIDRATYVGNVSLSAKPFTGRRDIPYDEAVRTGTFVQGIRDVYLRIELRNWHGGSGAVAVTRPDGSVAAALPVAPPNYRYGWTKQRLRLDLTAVGRWTVSYSLDGRTLAEAPFDVVATAREVRNRAPNAIGAALEPAAPRSGEVVVCKVATSLVTEDPDYDLVRYLYRWTAGDRVVRQVTSAALSDAIPSDVARAGETLRCDVTPSDGRLRGATVSAGATVAP
jgi:murein DD-endopeptidase MepM/ murein hydrolase activator NlpD